MKIYILCICACLFIASTASSEIAVSGVMSIPTTIQEIGPAKRPPQEFTGCGTLQRGPQTCFIFEADSGEYYFVENHDGFDVGDRVYVAGTIVEESEICWPFVGPAIERNTIQECYSGCGVLAHGPQTCTIFHGDDGRGFAVDNLGDFFVGDRVYVSGPILIDSLACWPAIVDKIEDNSIFECFDDCGVLGRGPQTCATLHADDGRGFLLRNTGDFTIGDRVHVIGPIVEESVICSPVVGPAIEDPLVYACEE